MARLGFDLGTTNTVLARDGDALPVHESGRKTLPSAVAFLPNGHVQVGEMARRRRAIDSANTLFSTKRIIGRRFDSHEARNYRSRYPMEIEELDGGWPAFRTRAGLVTPVDASVHVLKESLERTDTEVGDAAVTVTVPASFAEPQRRATLEAAAKADLGEVMLLEEPLATAYAYLAAGHRAERALVYDLGGGTFDCAVVDCSGDLPALLSHASDLLLGGDDIDHRLAGWVTSSVIQKHNWDLSNYSEVYDRLLAQCEQAKIELSTHEVAEFLLAQVDPECPASEEPVIVSRRLLSGECRELLQRSFTACDDVLRGAGLRASDIDAVYLAGGTSLLPMVQEGVEAYFGRRGLLEIAPTEVVAIGASCVEG